MDLKNGLISVIMSNFNTPEEYLRCAIESVLGQSYHYFEFIIVDDCSTDGSLDVIRSYNDPRIILIENKENIGITKSLNKALSIAKGEFIARMDADDECLEKRFEKQVEFLAENPSVIVCGTWVKLFGNGVAAYQDKYSCKVIPTMENYQIQLLFGNHINIIHPTAMFRHSILRENGTVYNEKYIYAQDYRMWVSCSRLGECANVPEVLFRYRIHNKAVSNEKKDMQMDCTKRIIAEQLSWLELELPDEWEKIHFGFLTGRKIYDLHIKEWLERIILGNRIHKIYNQKLLEKVLWEKWAEITYFALYDSNAFERIHIMSKLPIKYYKTLLRIWNQRR